MLLRATRQLLLAGLVTCAVAVHAAAPILIAGSDYTMPRFTESWIAGFNARGGVQVQLERRGTATGPPALLSGRAQIAAMSRELDAAEREAYLRERGREPLGIPVAADAIAIFVHVDNPLPSLTPRQVDALFSADRACGGEADAARWGDLGVGAERASRPIRLYGRRPGSGTGEFFRAVALCDGRFKTSIRVAPGPQAAVMAAAADPDGIGFASRADLRAGVRAVPIETGSGPASIDAEDVYSGRYPYARRLYFYVDPTSPAPGLADFLRYVLSPDSQLAVESAGYLPVPRELARRSLARLP